MALSWSAVAASSTSKRAPVRRLSTGQLRKRGLPSSVSRRLNSTSTSAVATTTACSFAETMVPAGCVEAVSVTRSSGTITSWPLYSALAAPMGLA